MADDEDVWCFVLAALSICARVGARGFVEQDLYGTKCVEWRTAYCDCRSFIVGEAEVDLREAVHTHFYVTEGPVGTTCGTTECLNPQHFEGALAAGSRRAYPHAARNNPSHLHPTQQYLYDLMLL